MSGLSLLRQGPWLAQALVAVGVFIAVYAVVRIVLDRYRWNEDIVRAAGFEFYHSRQALTVSRPIRDHLKGAEEVWALWNAGTAAGEKDVHDLGRIKRLLLVNPNTAFTAELARIVDRDSMDLSSDIDLLTKQARQAHIDVRWLRCSAACTMTIGNPERGHGWVHVETLIAKMRANNRPSFRVTQDKFPELFAELVKAYRDIWDSDDLSSEPDAV